jgi:hypothetical protein
MLFFTAVASNNQFEKHLNNNEFYLLLAPSNKKVVIN